MIGGSEQVKKSFGDWIFIQIKISYVATFYNLQVTVVISGDKLTLTLDLEL